MSAIGIPGALPGKKKGVPEASSNLWNPQTKAKSVTHSASLYNSGALWASPWEGYWANASREMALSNRVRPSRYGRQYMSSRLRKRPQEPE